MPGFNTDGTAKSGPAPVTEERISFLRQLKVLTVKNYKIKKTQTRSIHDRISYISQITH